MRHDIRSTSLPGRASVLAMVGASLFVALRMAPAAEAPADVQAPRKHVLAWADVRNGYQHDSISHAVATIERLGRQSGLYDTFIRTDSQLITKRPIRFGAGTGIASGESFQARNLNYFDAIFFFGVREIDLTAEQRADLLSFVKDDGKGFVAAHSAITAFFSWPEFGEMIGGRFDEHPWGVTDATVAIDDPQFPAMRGFPATSVFLDEHYQLKEFSRDKVRVLAHLDPSKLDLQRPLVHRTDGDFPIAWAKTYGKGRVFYSTLGHAAEAWDNPLVSQMYFEAIKWSLGLVDGDATPRPRSPTSASTTPFDAGVLPAGTGRVSVLTMCSGCHGLATSIAQPHTRLEWQALVDLMRQRGAPGTEDDAAGVVAYLTRHLGRVNVNRASREDLEAVLELSQTAAAAIVEYRTQNGRFQSWDDLQRVPGLDSRQIQEKKARIIFTDG